MSVLKKIISKINPISIINSSDFFDAIWYEEKYGIDRNKAAEHYLKIGFKEDYNPSSNFSSHDYLYLNPDIGDMNPLLHYEMYGKYEHRKIVYNLTDIPQNSNENLETPIFYINGEIPQKVNTCAVFATYSFDGTIPEYVVYYLKELHKYVDYIVIVGDYFLKNADEVMKLNGIVGCAIYQRHKCYDFGSYRVGLDFLRKYGLTKNAKELYLVNDSCYGPVFDLKNIFNKMKEKKCDFWGLLDSTDKKYHIQSFFYCFKNKVINDQMFYNFFERAKPNMKFEEVVSQLEHDFTAFLEEKYISDCCFKGIAENAMKSYSGNSNSTIWPISIMKQGFPFVKVKALDGRFGSELHENREETLEFIRTANADLYSIIQSDLKRRGVALKNAYDINSFEELDYKKIVSFDIFDTLLIRPFVNPTDLFKYLEVEKKADGFFDARINAEKVARKNISYEEITLDDIYKYIIPKFKDFKEFEIEYEMNLCLANPKVQAIYDYAVKNDKKIIAISDMYLPKKVLEDLLEKNGFSEIRKVYVSSEIKYTKGHGKLFKYVLKDLEISPTEIIHIGDNIESDINQANKLGISTYQITKVFDDFIQAPANTKYKLLWESQPQSLGLSATLSMLAIRYSRGNTMNKYWTELAYNIAGPLIISYLNYICSEAKANKIDKLLFTARDGYFLEKMYNDYFYDDYKISSSYSYLTRAVILSATLKFNENPSYLKTIMKLAKKSVKDLYVYNDYLYNLEEFNEKREIINTWAKKNYDNLKSFLEKQTENSTNVAVVDMASGRYTSLNGAHELIGKVVKMGLFFGSFNLDEPVLPYETFCNRNLVHEDDNSINLSEILISSPEESIISVDEFGNPVYKKQTSETRKMLYDQIEKGIREYIEEFQSVFGNSKNVLLNGNECLDLYKFFYNYMTPVDKNEFSKMEHTTNPF